MVQFGKQETSHTSTTVTLLLYIILMYFTYVISAFSSLYTGDTGSLLI